MIPVLRNHINCYLKRRKPLNLCFKRNHKKDHWSVLEKKVAPHDKALKHFDDFYKELFKKKWPSVRLALQERNKQVVVLNNFGDVEETIQSLQSLGAFDLKTYFDMHEEIVMNKLRAEVEGEDSDEELIESSTTGSERPALASSAVQKQLKTSDSDLNFLYPDTCNKNEEIKKILLEDEDQEKPEEIDEIQFQSIDNEIVEYDKDRIIDPEIGMSSAALNEFTPATKLMGLEDFVPEEQYYKYYQMETTGFKVNIEKEYLLEYPKNLKVYTFDRGDISKYPQPELGSANVFNYYILDGASVLTVLALGVQPKDYVLDMCAAPGGKSITILQTLDPDLVVCNEINTARHRRLTRTIDTFFYDKLKYKDRIRITKQDALTIEENEFYNKILVDVPCTNDKVSLYKDESNYFTESRIKERLQLPEVQSQLLAHALKIVNPKGTVVYSTCTLSPIQNDGVVHMALQQVWNDTGMEFTVIDMSPALQCTKELFNYGDYLNLRYGHLVVPFLPSNFGPMYFCKIKKN